MRYALGVLAAFQEQRVPFTAASGCVEMLLPLWLYFNKPSIDIGSYVSTALSTPPSMPNIIPAMLDPRTWINYFESVAESLGPPPDIRKLASNSFGPAGLFMFNPLYFHGEAGQQFETLMSQVTVPIFTNALDAATFDEVYLYSGELPSEKVKKEIIGRQGAKGRRRLERLTVDRFCASGTRPPFLAPAKVRTDSGEERYWTEGAMR